jgi:hypothetical protein
MIILKWILNIVWGFGLDLNELLTFLKEGNCVGQQSYYQLIKDSAPCQMMKEKVKSRLEGVRGREVNFRTFLISAMYGSERSASHTYRFTPGEWTPSTRWILDFMGPSFEMDEAEKHIPCPWLESNPFLKPVVSQFTDCCLWKFHLKWLHMTRDHVSVFWYYCVVINIIIIKLSYRSAFLKVGISGWLMNVSPMSWTYTYVLKRGRVQQNIN